MFDTVNTIYFDIYEYAQPNISVKEIRDLMFKDINECIRILIKNKYVVVIKELDKDLVILEYNFSNSYVKSDAVNPYWMKECEKDRLEEYKNKIQEFQRRLP